MHVLRRNWLLQVKLITLKVKSNKHGVACPPTKAAEKVLLFSTWQNHPFTFDKNN
jgi:hypothetical protein